MYHNNQHNTLNNINGLKSLTISYKMTTLNIDYIINKRNQLLKNKHNNKTPYNLLSTMPIDLKDKYSEESIYAIVNIIINRASQVNLILKRFIQYILLSIKVMTTTVDKFQITKKQKELYKLVCNLPKTTSIAVNEFIEGQFLFLKIKGISEEEDNKKSKCDSLIFNSKDQKYYQWCKKIVKFVHQQYRIGNKLAKQAKTQVPHYKKVKSKYDTLNKQVYEYLRL